MALQGPFAVIADSPAPDVVEALRAAGAFPVIEATWTDAPAALASVEPEAVILAEPPADRSRAAKLAELLAEQRQKAGGLFMPVIARTRDDGAAALPDALAIPANAPADAPGAPAEHGAARAHAARHRLAPHPHAHLARRAGAGLGDERSARRGQRARRRTRPLLSGAFGRGRRARRRGRRALRRERGARAQCPRHRRHGDRRRFRPENRRGAVDRARRGRALSRPAGRRARRPSRRGRAVRHGALPISNAFPKARKDWSTACCPMCARMPSRSGSSAC